MTLPNPPVSSRRQLGRRFREEQGRMPQTAITGATVARVKQLASQGLRQSVGTTDQVPTFHSSILKASEHSLNSEVNSPCEMHVPAQWIQSPDLLHRGRRLLQRPSSHFGA